MISALFPAVARSADGVSEIELLVFDRPPYYVVDIGGGLSGIVVDRVRQAFEKAGIGQKWRVVAANRHLKLVQGDGKPLCAVGWFRKPEREAMGKFTRPIYTDRPMVALMRADNGPALAHKALGELLADSTLKLGRKLGFSYGGVVDGLITEKAPPMVTSAQENTGLLRMLLGRRFDYMFIGAEEAEALLERFGVAQDDIAFVTLGGMPEGNDRHLICSRSVPDAVIDAVNAAIPAQH